MHACMCAPTWWASRMVVSVTMTPFFSRTQAAMASGPFASSTDLAVSSGAGTAPPEEEPRAGTGGVVVIPWGARPLCAERSPWMACSARKTASLQGVVTALAGLDLGMGRRWRRGGSGRFAGRDGSGVSDARGRAREGIRNLGEELE